MLYTECMLKNILFCLTAVTLLVFLTSCSKTEKQEQTSSSSKKSQQVATSENDSSEQNDTTAPQGKQNDSMTISNHPPEIKNARFITGQGHTLQVEVESEDQDGDPVTLQYSWTVNGQDTEDHADSITDLKRGDKVEALITPSDGKQTGQAKGLFAIIQNQSPKIVPSQPEFNDPQWKLKVDASDPDNDPLTYTLTNAPAGMTVDNGGNISWNVSGVEDGNYSATIEVTDGQGGTNQYTFNVVVGHEKPPEAQE